MARMAMLEQRSLCLVALLLNSLLAACSSDNDGANGDSSGGGSSIGGTSAGGTSSGTAGSTSSSGTADDLWVVGSHPDYQWDQVGAGAVPYDHLTHLFLSFLEPTGSAGSYTMEVTGWGPSSLASWTTQAQAFITAAHEANVKVLVDLGGMGGADEVFIDACASSSNTTAMATMISSTLQELGFDGVDLDWEGENYDGACAATLLQALRAEWSDGLITTAIGPIYGDTEVTQMNALAAAADDIDAVMLMSYIPPDQSWTWWVVPVPLTPLHGASVPWEDTPQPYSVDRDRTVLTDAGFPASKLVMGVGGFGLVWGDTNGDGTAPVAPYSNYDALADDETCFASPWTCGAGADTEIAPISCSDNSVTQLWLDEALSAAGSAFTLRTDDVGEVNYWAASSPTELVTLTNPCGSGTVDVGLILYETAASIANKVGYVNEYGMRGLEFWTMAQAVNANGQFPLLEAARP